MVFFDFGDLASTVMIHYQTDLAFDVHGQPSEEFAEEVRRERSLIDCRLKERA